MKGTLEFERAFGTWHFVAVITYLPSSEVEIGLRGSREGGSVSFFLAGIGFHLSAYNYPSNVG